MVFTSIRKILFERHNERYLNLLIISWRVNTFLFPVSIIISSILLYFISFVTLMIHSASYNLYALSTYFYFFLPLPVVSSLPYHSGRYREHRGFLFKELSLLCCQIIVPVFLAIISYSLYFQLVEYLYTTPYMVLSHFDIKTIVPNLHPKYFVIIVYLLIILPFLLVFPRKSISFLHEFSISLTMSMLTYFLVNTSILLMVLVFFSRPILVLIFLRFFIIDFVSLIGMLTILFHSIRSYLALRTNSESEFLDQKEDPEESHVSDLGL